MFRVRQVDAYSNARVKSYPSIDVVQVYCPTNGVQFSSPGVLFIPEGLEKPS